jgi:3-oxoacyl-[acyl-carrier-protein] synthase-3
VDVGQISIADDQRMHTAALAAAFEREVEKLPAGAQVLFVAAGAGVTAGAALYRRPPEIGIKSECG